MRTYLAAILVSGLLLGATPSAVAQNCVTQSERAAMAVRHIQTQLMVGALACRGSKDLGQRDLYTKFVLENRQSLGRHARALRGYFARLYGSDAQTRLDRHVTGIANRISRDAGRQADFCEKIVTFGENVLANDLKPAELLPLSASAPVTFRTEQPVCEAGATTSIAE